MFSKEIMKLVKPFNEAIKIIAERQARKCADDSLSEQEKIARAQLKRANQKGRRCLRGISGVALTTAECRQIARDFALSEKQVCRMFPHRRRIESPEVKWEWKPKLGEWCIMDNPLFPTPHLICTHNFNDSNDSLKQNIKHYIPLLCQNRIEEILEGMGYKVWTNKFYDDPRGKYLCKIAIPDYRFDTATVLARARANSAQQAVMLAVIELGKRA